MGVKFIVCLNTLSVEIDVITMNFDHFENFLLLKCKWTAAKSTIVERIYAIIIAGMNEFTNMTYCLVCHFNQNQWSHKIIYQFVVIQFASIEPETEAILPKFA